MKKQPNSKIELVRATVVTVVVILVVLLPQLIAWLPGNEILGPTGRDFAANVRKVTIQGWGFFTRSPREPIFRLYKEAEYGRQSLSWEPLLRTPNNQLKNWFGLDRTSRLQEFDVSIVTRDLDTSDWVYCNDATDASSCVEDLRVKSMDHPGGSFDVCGRYLVMKTEPVPWSYRDLRKSMPGEAVIVNVIC